MYLSTILHFVQNIFKIVSSNVSELPQVSIKVLFFLQAFSLEVFVKCRSKINKYIFFIYPCFNICSSFRNIVLKLKHFY